MPWQPARGKTYRERSAWPFRGNLLSIGRSNEAGRTDLGACSRFRAAALSNSFFRNPIANTSVIVSKRAIQMPQKPGRLVRRSRMIDSTIGLMM